MTRPTIATDAVSPVTFEQKLNPGLTKREYFAAMAMQGIFANPASNDSKIHILVPIAVKAADELIKALNA